MLEWASLIRGIPDFPRAGVMFKDMAAPWRDVDIDLVCGIESRGFIFSAALHPCWAWASCHCV